MQVAGQNYAVYEAWYNHVSYILVIFVGSRWHDATLFYLFYFIQVDPKNLGSIGALDAANFLKKSGLSSTVLSKVI